MCGGGIPQTQFLRETRGIGGLEFRCEPFENLYRLGHRGRLIPAQQRQQRFREAREIPLRLYDTRESREAGPVLMFFQVAAFE